MTLLILTRRNAIIHHRTHFNGSCPGEPGSAGSTSAIFRHLYQKTTIGKTQKHTLAKAHTSFLDRLTKLEGRRHAGCRPATVPYEISSVVKKTFQIVMLQHNPILLRRYHLIRGVPIFFRHSVKIKIIEHDKLRKGLRVGEGPILTMRKHTEPLHEHLSTTQRRYHSYFVSSMQEDDDRFRQIYIFVVQCQQHIVLYWLQPTHAHGYVISSSLSLSSASAAEAQAKI